MRTKIKPIAPEGEIGVVSNDDNLATLFGAMGFICIWAYYYTVNKTVKRGNLIY